MKNLTDNEKRDLLRLLTIRRALMEADNPCLMVESEGAHLELCEQISALKTELDMAVHSRQEAA